MSTSAGGTGCGERPGVTVVLDRNELGGDDELACVPDTEGNTAADLFERAGHTLEYQPGLQDFVCRVDGRPTDRPCTAGDSYWSLWWAEPGGDWSYATLGVRSLEVPADGAVGFAWHEGDGDAEPPDLAPAEARGGTAVAGERGSAEGQGEQGADPFPWWGIALVVLVLGAAVLAVVLRRRSP